MVKTEGWQGEIQRKEQVKPRKKNAKKRLGDSGERAAAEGIGKSRENIVERAAEKPEQRAEQERVKMAHLKIPESFPLAAP